MGYIVAFHVMLVSNEAHKCGWGNKVNEEVVHDMEDTKTKRIKLCCPRCGQRLFRGGTFDIELECPSCHTKIEADREDMKITINMELVITENN